MVYYGIIRLESGMNGVFSYKNIACVACLAALCGGAIILVSFAVNSSELPPGNLVSTLSDVAAYYEMPENSQVMVLSPEEDWAVLTAFRGEFETGGGAEAQDRSQDIEYRIRPGETLSEIAYAYGISYGLLAWYNNISNANKIRVGTVIIIPSLKNAKTAESQYKQQKTKQTQAAAAARAVKNIKIAQESRNSGSGLKVQFSIANPPPHLRSFDWDLGDGKRSFLENPAYEYHEPKTYVVRLTARDNAGAIYRSNPLYIDIPYPESSVELSTAKFVTLSSPDDYFTVNGSITRVVHANTQAAPPDLSESDQFLTKVQFQESGYYGITVQEESGKEQLYSVFVSPVPTRHADLYIDNFNWYRTQHNTGTTSNCGPASASMAIGWGAGKYVPVSSVRQTLGWQGDGSTSFEELLVVIRNQGISASIQPFRSVQDIRNVIDAGNIAIFLFKMEGVKNAASNPGTNLFGKYYTELGGHYAVIKGYSLNGEYFVIHDPIPSDWAHNNFRYGDEISMIGRNRYYSATEVIQSLRRADMIVVSGK